MRGDIVYADGETYEVIYDGAHRGCDADLFNRVEAPVSVLAEKPRRISRQAACESLVDCFDQGSVWQTAELRDASGLTEAEFEAALNRLRRSGVLASVSRGVVQLVKRAQAAA